ncbi:MAG: Gfo/Idh/MocA family oxidoreductase [Candidatus Bathyarchaeia archaeon]|jgi:predicted dehydrogenase
MKKIWLVGAGYMAKEYAKILKALKREFTVIGRGKETAADFERALNVPVITGGVDNYIESSQDRPEYVIVTVDAQYLYEVSKKIMKFGVQNMLLEKPGALNLSDIRELQKLSTDKKSKVFIAYNRRFYSSVLKAKEIMKTDGGCTSFTFEFTEWSHLVKDSKKSEGEKNRWFIANSTHVVDLAFHLGGAPKLIECYASGGLDWHPSASIFSGAGVADNNALFSYHANWEAPGRWGVEVLTRKHRLILRPLEELQVQNLESVNVEKVELDDRLDKLFKPGLYRETESFLTGAYDNLKPLRDQVKDMQLYCKMANY